MESHQSSRILVYYQQSSEHGHFNQNMGILPYYQPTNWRYDQKMGMQAIIRVAGNSLWVNDNHVRGGKIGHFTVYGGFLK